MATPLVTSLPWLSNQSDPVATYQRSQALVQQMQAQQAQERQQQAALAQRAQEAAMQAQFQQRALALKEQEAKSAVQVEADRLRQKGQALEFENQVRQAEQRYLQAPPELVDFGDGTRGVKYRGAFHPIREPGVVSGRVRPSNEELMAQKQAQTDQKFVRNRLVAKEKELRELQPGTVGGKLIPDEPSQLKAVRDYIAVKKELDAIGKSVPGEKATPSPASERNPEQSGVRVRRKSDGKILRYKGNKADVPATEFEILE